MAYSTDALIDSVELAARLGTTTEKIAMLVSTNRIPYTKVNGQTKFDGKQVGRLRFLAAQCGGSGVLPDQS